uniref:hypothetical protein n=1 Tax=Pseudomonas fulva TaxID=47880 RepID=UPI001F1FB07A|nr:hypothetical protein [Pseudomonas fulva]
MPQITQQLADAIYSVSNFILILGAAMALAGTLGTAVSGKVRDRFSDERISANEAVTALAKKETAEALLEQQRLKADMAWRIVTKAQAVALAEGLKGGPKEVWLTWVGNDPEATLYREQLDQFFSAIGIKTKYYSGYVRAVGLNVCGGTEQERKIFSDAFTAAGIPHEVSDQSEMHDNTLEILVGTKPPPQFQGL